MRLTEGPFCFTLKWLSSSRTVNSRLGDQTLGCFLQHGFLGQKDSEVLVAGSHGICDDSDSRYLSDDSCSAQIFDKSLLDDNNSCIICYPGLAQRGVIPSAIHGIGRDCFRSSHITSLTCEADSRLTRIADSAFSHCLRPAPVCVTAFIEVLSGSCFSHCFSLSKLKFERGGRVSWIGRGAFAWCQFRSVSIPASVESLGGFCFEQYTTLSRLRFKSGSTLDTRVDLYFCISNCWNSSRNSFSPCTSLS
jgi:hypothetical protein